MHPAGFEPTTIPASERPQTHAVQPTRPLGSAKDTTCGKRQTKAPWLQHFSAASKSLCVRQSVSTRVCKQLQYTGLSSTRASLGSQMCSPWSPLWKFTLSAQVLKKRVHILKTVVKFWPLHRYFDSKLQIYGCYDYVR